MMRRLSFPLYIFTSLTLLAAQDVYAEDIAMPIGAQGNTSVQTPGRAWTQAKVEQNFGAPVSRRGPVGEPAITTWDYENFSVYFEGEHVIHTVKHYVSQN